MPYPYKPTNAAVMMTLQMADVSAPTTLFVAPGFTGRIRRVTTVLGGAITVADSLCKLQINTTDVTNGNWTVSQSGSAAGDIDSAVPTALNVFQATDHIRVISDGASTTTQPLGITLELEPV
jgi:hypothetical protein